jgi:hypothetical protein
VPPIPDHIATIDHDLEDNDIDEIGLDLDGITSTKSISTTRASGHIEHHYVTSWLSTLLSFLLLPIDDAFRSDDIQRVC